MPDPVVVRRRRRAAARSTAIPSIAAAPAARVLVQPHDRRRVDAGRAEQLVAVLLGTGQRPLVRQHPAVGPERLEPQPGEEPALRPLDVRARDPIGLLVHVHARARVLAQRPVGAPRGERARHAAVAVVGILVGRLRGRQVQADGVLRMAVEEPLVEVRADDVVRGSDHGTQLAGDVGVEPEGAERRGSGARVPRATRSAGRKPQGLANGVWGGCIVR